MANVLIMNGRYSTGRDSYREIKNVVFPLVDGTLLPSERGTYITVDGVPVRGYPKRAFKVFVNAGQYEITDADVVQIPGSMNAVSEVIAASYNVDIPVNQPLVLRGDDDAEIKERIKSRFRIINKLVNASVSGKVRSLIISGAAGVGKSHEVRETLENSFEAQATVLNALIDHTVEPDETAEDADPVEKVDVPPPPSYRFVSGHIAPMSLYQLLFDYRQEGCVLVLDDCDSVLYNEVSLNILKAAMNNKGRRVIDWGSRAVEAVGLPTSFEFNGALIMITNLDFDHPKFKTNSLGEHLKAIVSRVYYIDIGVKTVRECFLRIEQVCVDNQMLTSMGATQEDATKAMAFFEENITKFRELSIRTVEKIADAMLIDPTEWEELVRASAFKPECM